MKCPAYNPYSPFALLGSIHVRINGDDATPIPRIPTIPTRMPDYQRYVDPRDQAAWQKKVLATVRLLRAYTAPMARGKWHVLIHFKHPAVRRVRRNWELNRMAMNPRSLEIREQKRAFHSAIAALHFPFNG